MEQCQAFGDYLVQVHKLDVKTKGAVAVQICLVACPVRAWAATTTTTKLTVHGYLEQ